MSDAENRLPGLVQAYALLGREIDTAVMAAREDEGVTYERLGELLGVTTQGARHRYRTLAERRDREQIQTKGKGRRKR